MKNDPPLVCVSYPGFLSRGGGVPQHIRQLQKGLDRAGYPHHVLSTESLSVVGRYLPYLCQILTDSVRAPWGFVLRNRMQARGFSRLAEPIARRHARSLHLFQSIYSTYVCEQPGLTMLHALFSDNLQGRKVTEAAVRRLRRHESQLLQERARPVITVSVPYRHWVEEQLKDCGGIGTDLEVIPNGIDMSCFPEAPRERPRDRLNLVFVGRFDANKNPMFLIEVMKRLRDRNGQPIHLHLIGDGILAPALRAAVERSGLQSQVHFRGRLRYEEVAEELQNHHILLQPSSQETFGYSLLEAKLAGARTIVRSGLTVPEEFCDLRCDLDVDQWVTAVGALTQAPPQDDRAESLRHLRREYSAERMVARLLNAVEAAQSRS